MEGRVLYARRDGACVLRFEGPIRYTMAHSLDTFLNKLFAQCPPESICADLNAAESIDSTGIGLLAKIANGLRDCGCGKPLLFSCNHEINEVLCNVCLDEVFVIVEAMRSEAGGDELPATDPSNADLAQTILGAHRLLCELSESNRARFQDVVDALEVDPNLNS